MCGGERLTEEETEKFDIEVRMDDDMDMERDDMDMEEEESSPVAEEETDIKNSVTCPDP